LGVRTVMVTGDAPATMAGFGIAMMPLPLLIIRGTNAGAVALAFLTDIVKIYAFSHLKIA